MLFKMVLSKRGSRRISRMTYDEDQIEELEKEYAKSPYLNNANRKKLSQKMGVDERRLKIWFQNRRMREKTKTQRNDKDVKIERKLRSAKKANPVAEPVSVKSASPVSESLLTKSSSPPCRSCQSPKWIPQVPHIYGKSCFDAPRSEFPHCHSSCAMISRRYLPPYAVRKPMHHRNSAMPECVKDVHSSKDFGDAASCQTSTCVAHSSMISSSNTFFNNGLCNDWESSHIFRKVPDGIDCSVTKENNHACCANCNKLQVTSSSPGTEPLSENSRNRSFHLLPNPNAMSTDQSSKENINNIYRNNYEDLNADTKHCIFNSESYLCYDKIYSSKLHSPHYSIENILRPPLQTLEYMVEDVDNYQRAFSTSKCCRSSHQLLDISHQSSNQWHCQRLSDTDHKQSIQFDMPYSQSLSSTKLQPITQWQISSPESLAESAHHQSYQWQTPSPQSTSVKSYQPIIESHNPSFKSASSLTSASTHQPSVEWHGSSSKSLSSQTLFDTNLQQSNEWHIPSSQTSLVDSYQLPDERPNCSSRSLIANPQPSFQWHRPSTHSSLLTSHRSTIKRQSSSQLSTSVDNQQRLSQCHDSPPQSSLDNGYESSSQWHSLSPQSSVTCHEPSSQWHNSSSRSSAVTSLEQASQWYSLSPQSSSVSSHEIPSQSHHLSPQSSSVFSNEPSSEWQGLSPQSSSVTSLEPSSQWHSLSPQSSMISRHEPSSQWHSLSPRSASVSSLEQPNQWHGLFSQSSSITSSEQSSEWQGLSPQSSSVTSSEKLSDWKGLSPQLPSPNSKQSPSCSYLSNCQPVFQNSTTLDIQSAYQTPEVKPTCSYQFDTQEISQNDYSTYWSLRQL
ncbi:uncharacterized protein [Parasteatoda tepidariorum]|uniref:uncharacterized protein n=1 Tax=Parasteatoda tepidariorum TaxID=114398 RepID=UPI001C726246|nr:flocculation protein FLO11 [Parasteatoda tepidariorum]